MKVSASLIVRDSESTLPGCLDSIQGAFDELIVVDTGSTDTTREIAQRYGAKLYSFPWTNDFSEARNFALDQCSGDWCFWLDADDVVENASGIREAVNSATPEIAGFYWKYILTRDQYGNPTSQSWRERLVRKGAFSWKGAIHELLTPKTQVFTLRDPAVSVIHCRPDSISHSARNLNILLQEFAYSLACPLPAADYERLLFYLGNEFLSTGRYAQAIEFYGKYVEKATWTEQKYIALLWQSWAQRKLGAYEAGVHCALGALALFPAWSPAFYAAAEGCYYLKQWEKVVTWTELGMTRKEPTTILPVDLGAIRYDWMIHYTVSLWHLGRLEEGLEWTRRALALRPGDPMHLANERYFSGLLGVKS